MFLGAVNGMMGGSAGDVSSSSFHSGRGGGGGDRNETWELPDPATFREKRTCLLCICMGLGSMVVLWLSVIVVNSDCFSMTCSCCVQMVLEEREPFGKGK